MLSCYSLPTNKIFAVLYLCNNMLTTALALWMSTVYVMQQLLSIKLLCISIFIRLPLVYLMSVNQRGVAIAFTE